MRAPQDTVTSITVRMGEIASGNRVATMRTLLGSCIGIAIYDSRHGVGGLAHIVLPSSAGHDGPVGKFVDTAVPELIQQIKRLGGERRRLRAKIAGGANMFSASTDMTIGDQNLTAVQHELGAQSVPITATHCGGTQGRRMTFHPGTGGVTIEIVGSKRVDI